MGMSEPLSWDDLIGRNTDWKQKGEAQQQRAKEGVLNATNNYMQAQVNDMLAPPVKKKRKKKRKVEAPIQSKIIKAIKAHGATNVERTNSGQIEIPNGDGTFRWFNGGTKGKADIHCVYRGIRFALEVKVPKTATTKKTYTSKLQKKYLNKFAKNGGCAAVVRSVDDAIQVLMSGEVGEVVKW
jgi:hypothetical protein